MKARAVIGAATLGVILVLDGCASWRGLDAKRVESEARADDAACVAKGLSFPSESYDHCRRHILDDRIDDARHEVVLGTQTSPYAPPETPREPEGVHRTIDPERFHCVARGEGAERVIICEEK
jgi:hypothetical protein